MRRNLTIYRKDTNAFSSITAAGLASYPGDAFLYSMRHPAAVCASSINSRALELVDSGIARFIVRIHPSMAHPEPSTAASVPSDDPHLALSNNTGTEMA